MSSSCFLPLWEALQDKSVSLTQAPLKLLLLSWVPDHMRFCVHILRAVSISYSPLALPKVSSLTFKKPHILQVYLPDIGPPGWRAPHGIWTSHALEKTSEIIIILPFMGRPSRCMGLDYNAIVHLISSLYL